MSGTLLQVLAEHRRSGAGDRPAIVDSNGQLTYAELERAVSARARELVAAGLGSESRVAVVMSGSIRSIVEFAAVTAVQADVLVLQQRTGEQERAMALADFRADILLTDGGQTELRPTGGGSAKPHGEPAFAVTSSGTVGRPRVISRSWAATFDNSRTFAAAFALGADDRVLTTSPLGHSYAIEAGTLAVLAAGACQLIPSGPPTPAQAAGWTERHGCTVLQTVPLLLGWYGRSGLPKSTGLDRCVSAGDVLTAEAATMWQDAGIAVADHYGNSELGQLTLAPVGGRGSVGMPLPGVELMIGSREQEGPISARYPGVLPVRLEEGIPVALADGDGWVHTGDLGVLDDAGLRLTGRSNLIINVAGNKVNPADVERALREIRGVSDCAVVGRVGPDGGQQVWAFVEAAAEEFDASRIRRDVSQLLNGSQVPAVIRRVEVLPRTGSGKVRRGLLMAEGDFT
jgi:acyl-coenzyme A synthetase/AMP-(fatty) acid ligase